MEFRLFTNQPGTLVLTGHIKWHYRYHLMDGKVGRPTQSKLWLMNGYAVDLTTQLASQSPGIGEIHNSHKAPLRRHREVSKEVLKNLYLCIQLYNTQQTVGQFSQSRLTTATAVSRSLNGGVTTGSQCPPFSRTLLLCWAFHPPQLPSITALIASASSPTPELGN